MRSKIEKIAISLSVVGCMATSLSAVEIGTILDAINIAGKQRMFTQRMLKDYAMVGMGNTFGNPKADLLKTSSDFDDHLASLAAFTKDDATKKVLEGVKVLWIPLKKMLSEAPTKEKVGGLQRDLDVLMKASDDAVKLLSASSGKKSGEIIDISGRQRMLSQRMASLYMLKVWEVNDPEFKTKLDDSMKLFKDSLAKLEASSLNTDEIKAHLTQAKRSFMFLEMMNKSKSKFIPTLVYKKSNEILDNMNSATHKYAATQK
jgi:nitrate/nitrite-specific signal transduction histidine kinase